MARRTCKKCNGEVVYKKHGRFFYTTIFSLAGGCMMWIPFIGWLAAPLCFILALVMLACPVHYFVQCVRCGEVVNITKEEYEEVVK